MKRLKHILSKKWITRFALAAVMLALASPLAQSSVVKAQSPFGDAGCFAQEVTDQYTAYNQLRHRGVSRQEALRASGLSIQCLKEILQVENVENQIINSLPEDPQLEELKEALQKIHSKADAQKALFFSDGFNEEDKEISVDQKSGEYDKFIPFLNRRITNEGYQPYEGSRLTKFTGNPYFILNNGQSGGAHNCLHDIDSGDCVDEAHGTDRVRFVLTSVVYGHEPDIESPLPGGDSGDYNAWIFRNEFNPSLALEFTSRDDSGDEKHLTFYRACNSGILGDDAQVSQINWGSEVDDEERFDPPLTNEDDRDKVDDIAKAYHGLNVCDVNNGFFAGMIQQALTAIKEGIDAIFDWVKDALLNVFDIGTLTSNTGLVDAWKTLRDFVNLIFVILLSIVAFSNILRIDTEKYGVRALLPRLVFAVIAVNFSFLIVQIMTNVAYVISQPFANKAFDLLSNPPADGSLIDPTAGIGQFLIAIAMVLAVLFGFAIVFIFFVIRIIMIWMLAALSPFVFLAMVLPLTRSVAAMWWKNAFKWIFMGPIAFIVLFIAASIVASVGGKDQDINGPDFALKIAFFVAASVAAVLIPLKIGGEVMQKGFNASKVGGKLGGKGLGKAGMFAADRKITSKLPGGGDETLGTRMRAAKAGLAARGDLKEERANEYLAAQMADGKGVGRLTGASTSQQATAFDSAVGKKAKELNTYDTGAKLRMLHARVSGASAGDNITTPDGTDLGVLSEDEHQLANDKVTAAAAFKELAQTGLATPEMMHGPRGMAFTGYQGLSSDPEIASIDRNGQVREGVRDALAGTATADSLKGRSSEHFDRLKDAVDSGDFSNDTVKVFVKTDGRLLNDAKQSDHRNKLNTTEKRKAVHESATKILQAHQQGKVKLSNDELENMKLAASGSFKA